MWTKLNQMIHWSIEFGSAGQTIEVRDYTQDLKHLLFFLCSWKCLFPLVIKGNHYMSIDLPSIFAEVGQEFVFQLASNIILFYALSIRLFHPLFLLLTNSSTFNLIMSSYVIFLILARLVFPKFVLSILNFVILNSALCSDSVNPRARSSLSLYFQV